MRERPRVNQRDEFGLLVIVEYGQTPMACFAIFGVLWKKGG